MYPAIHIVDAPVVVQSIARAHDPFPVRLVLPTTFGEYITAFIAHYLALLTYKVSNTPWESYGQRPRKTFQYRTKNRHNNLDSYLNYLYQHYQ